MIKTVKRTLPVVVLIIHTAGSIGLWSQTGDAAILVGGIGASLIIALLFYAVIRWDEQFAHEEREKRQLASVVDHAMDAIVVCDSVGRLLYGNASACNDYDIDPANLQMHSIEAIGLRGTLRSRVFEAVLAGSPFNGELSLIREDGHRLVHLVSIFKLEEFQGHQNALVSIGRNVTEHKALERKLLHSQKLAAVGELAAGVSHEINNPMAAIQGQIGLAKDLITLDSKCQSDSYSEVLACLDESSQQIVRCSQIVESLLSFSRQSEPDVQRVRLHEPIEQAIRFVNSLPRLKGIEVDYEPADDMPWLNTDAAGITQILLNLMVNAADAMDQVGTMKIRAQKCADRQVSIIVTDDGCGIAPQDLDRVFEPFFTTKPVGKGTGLGLALSYGIAQSLGGELSLNCPPQGGTIATLTLPIAPRLAERRKPTDAAA